MLDMSGVISALPPLCPRRSSSMGARFLVSMVLLSLFTFALFALSRLALLTLAGPGCLRGLYVRVCELEFLAFFLVLRRSQFPWLRGHFLESIFPRSACRLFSFGPYHRRLSRSVFPTGTLPRPLVFCTGDAPALTPAISYSPLSVQFFPLTCLNRTYRKIILCSPAALTVRCQFLMSIRFFFSGRFDVWRHGLSP